MICYAPSSEFDYLIMIFRLYGLSTACHNFFRNAKTLEPKTYITILNMPQVISGRNIKGPFLRPWCRPLRGGQGEWLLRAPAAFAYNQHRVFYKPSSADVQLRKSSCCKVLKGLSFPLCFESANQYNCMLSEKFARLEYYWTCGHMEHLRTESLMNYV